MSDLNNSNSNNNSDMETIFGKNIEKQPEKIITDQDEKEKLEKFAEKVKEQEIQEVNNQEINTNSDGDYQLQKLVKDSKNSASITPYNSLSAISTETSEEEIKKLEEKYGINSNDKVELSETENIDLSNSKEVENPTTKKKTKTEKKNNTNNNSSFNIKDTEKESTIKVVRETIESVTNYEKQEEEKLKEKIEKENKQEEERIDSIVNTIESEMKQPSIEEIKEEEENKEDNNKFKISSFQIDKDNNRKEILDNSYNTKDENEEEEIEYLGGNLKKLDELSFESRANEWGTRYIKAKTVPEKITGKDLLINSQKDFEEYAKQKPRFTNAFKTKVALPYSGMTLYVSSYTSATMLQLMRAYGKWRAQYEYASNTENLNLMKSEAYLKLRRIELESIYEHISGIYLVNKGKIEKPDMETLFKMIKYPDLPALYFAVYHGTNKNKRKKYTITCRKELIDKETGQVSICNTDNKHEFYDEELVFSIGNKKLTKEDFYKLIRDGYPKDQVLPITEDARVEIERMTETKTNIVQAVPSIYDYLETLDILYDFMSDTSAGAAFDYDLSLIDNEIPQDEWDDPRYDTVKFLKSYLYTKRVAVLWLDNSDKKEGSYRIIDSAKGQRRFVFDVIQSLELEDMYFLTKGEEIKKMMTLKAIDYYIPETTCSNPDCKNVIKPIKFDVRTNFFILLSVARTTI